MDGNELYNLLKVLFPINRSLTGEGVRETFIHLKRYVNLNIYTVKSGEKFYDWEVPKEWSIESAVVKDENGKILIDFAENNLHVVGYSEPFSGWLSKEELFEHLYYLNNLPDAIPYITSYYQRNWGFCIQKSKLHLLDGNRFFVDIKSKLFNGELTYADYVIKGSSSEEVVFSTYICHPSMASNELSGPVVAIGLIDYLNKLEHRKYTYRFVFVPETIGSIIYINKHLNDLKTNVIAGFVLTCLGDDACYSIVNSRKGLTIADEVGLAVLGSKINHKIFSFLERGSDERQYCAPHIDLPFVTLSRTKFYEYPEYHTSLDDLNFTSPEALKNSLDFVKDIVILLERNKRYEVTNFCEPQLGKRGLYPNVSTKESNNYVKDIMNVIAYLDGTIDLIQLVKILKIDVRKLMEIIDQLLFHKLIKVCE